MRIEFNRTGAERKALVQAMGEVLGVKPNYLGMPTAAYEVGYFRIDKNGVVECDDADGGEQVENLLERLAGMGFIAAETPCEGAEPPERELPAAPDNAPQNTSLGLTVAIPRAKAEVGNLTKLLEAKGNLIKKALGIDALPVEVTEDSVSFPWFSEVLNADEAKAYTHFISALCKMSIEQKRITATEKPVDNEKYAFRCFLLRLGFIGADYKSARKILLRNLTGSGAFKSGAKHTTENLQPEPPNAAMRVAVDDDPAFAETPADAMLIEQVNASFGGEDDGIPV